ncbi:amidase [Actinomycetospora endophytica]|uniref:Amidase n=1 Tax=Actinomycetospora endophytica TaxID=2291215 RepID=A0ABS8PH09_9PSEU|nr:amidase [Actinomycetospora endophytica]MCD2197549.1 amidase [Actinomycetospora endophytica]
MPLPTPDHDALTAVAAGYGLGLSAAEVDEYAPVVAGLLASWDAVAELYDAEAPVAPRRAWSRPEEAENPYNAWYVTTSITESGSGPLAGRTVAVKDNTAVAGVPMTNGSATVEGFVPSSDATIVRRLLDAGATIAGKAVCEDLCFSGAGITASTGHVRNPWDPARHAGGSSGGSAALVAGGVVDMATGGDQGGSIRIPASDCGVVGHKPTWGLVPYTGAFPIEATIDHVGPITRTVTDAALMLTVIAGADGQDPRQPMDLTGQDYVAALATGAQGLRVGVLREGFGLAESEPETDEAVRAATGALADAGMTVTEVSVPWHLHGPRIWDVIATEGATSQMIDTYGYGLNWKGRYDPEVMDHYGRRWTEDGRRFPETVNLVLLAGKYGLDTAHGRYYAMARNLAPKLAAAYDAALAEVDVLVMPTLPMRATVRPGPDARPPEILGTALEMLANTSPFDVTGHPACSVPAPLAGGLPVGMMLVGRQFDDATVLRAAHAYEQAVGGFPAPAAATAAV